MNSFWQKAAVMYNDEKVTFTLLMVLAQAARHVQILHNASRAHGVQDNRRRLDAKALRLPFDPGAW